MAIEVYPVVHVKSMNQTLEQVGMVLEEGVDGVYLIDHEFTIDDNLTPIFERVKEEFPDGFVGVNYLGYSSLGALNNLLNARQTGDISDLPNGLWVDDAIRDRYESRSLRRWNRGLKRMEYLGGVAFKYTSGSTDDPEFAAFQADALSSFVDVVTTSGPETGSEPSPSKIRAMKNAIGKKKLAIASGIDAGNLSDYAGFVSKVLVSSSLETDYMSGEFVRDKVRELVDIANELPSA